MKKILFFTIAAFFLCENISHAQKQTILNTLDTKIVNNPSLPMRASDLNSILKSILNYPVDTLWMSLDTVKYKVAGVTKNLILGNTFVTPWMFGGIGNGIANDHDAIQACVNTKHCYVPNGYWLTNTSINIPDSSIVFGNGSNSIIVTSNNIDVLSAVNKTNISIKDLTLMKSGSRGTSKAIMFNGSTFNSTLIDNVSWYGFDKGFYYTGAYLTHATLRVSNCVGRFNNYSFYNDAYGEYVTYGNCIGEYNTTGLFSKAGNVVFTGGSLSENTTAANIVYGDNNGHGAIIGTLMNHNTNDIIIDSVTVSFLVSNVHSFFGNVKVVNSNNITFENCQFSRQDTFSIQKSTRVSINNPLFFQQPSHLIVDTSKVRWFNPTFADRTTPLVPSTISGDLTVKGAISLNGKDSTTLKKGIRFSHNNVGESEDDWVGIALEPTTASAQGQGLKVRTHKDNSIIDTTLYDVALFDQNQNITIYNNLSVGSVNSGNFTSTGTVSAASLIGTLGTASQPNITAIGTLSNLTVTGGIFATNINASSNLTAPVASITNATIGTLGISNATVSNALTVSGGINGTLNTPAQPSITSLGNLSALTVTGLANLGNISGTLTTGNQSNITKVGVLNGITTGGTNLNDFNSSATNGNEAMSVSALGNTSQDIIHLRNVNGVTVASVSNAGNISTAGSIVVAGNLTVTGTVISAGVSMGSYSPTVGFTSNVTSYSLNYFSFTKQGNEVEIGGTFSYIPTTANTITYIRFSIPFASSFSSSAKLSGTAYMIDGGTNNFSGGVSANGGGSLIYGVPTVTGGITYTGKFTARYTIE